MHVTEHGLLIRRHDGQVLGRPPGDPEVQHELLDHDADGGLVTVGVLFVVVSGLCETGGVDWLGQRLLGRPRTLAGAQLRIMGPVAGLSASTDKACGAIAALSPRGT